MDKTYNQALELKPTAPVIFLTEKRRVCVYSFLQVRCLISNDQRCISAVLVPLFKQAVGGGGASSSNK